MSRARDLSDYVSTGVSAAEFDQLDTTSGTPGSGNFLRGDKTWASAGLDGVTTGSGNVTITDGNLILDAGNGIDFGDTTDGGVSTPSELLDDYEEGTWTPVLKSGVNTITTSSGTENATYTKIGNKVTIQWSFSNVTTAGTTGGGAYIEGLPFTAGTPLYALGSLFHVYGGLSFDSIPHFTRVEASSVIVYLKSQSATTYSGPLITAVGAGTYGGFQLTYWV
jgi:hypothetical protein